MQKRALFIILTTIVTGLIIGLIYTFQQSQVLGVVSPLGADEIRKADLKRIIFDRKTTHEYPPNEHFPQSLDPEFSKSLDINADAYAVMDRDTKKLVFAKNLTQELPIASVAKIMTAIVALERSDLEVELNVSEYAATIGEASMGLTNGERVRVEDLLYGLMLPSGNDAAETLADGLGGRDNFILGMNEKANELGLFDTYFFNPTGLDGETRETTSYSTALDLLALTDYALENPIFAKIVATHYWEAPYREGKHKALYLANILQLDWTYPGIKGVKPGVTDFSKETLVSYYEKDSKRYIVVLLGATHSRDEAIKLYDLILSI